MPTPLYVIKALAEVRDSGLTEMEDQDSVAMLVHNQRAAEWINEVSFRQYQQALNDLARAESDDWMSADQMDSEDDEERRNPFDLDGTDR